MGSGMGGAGGRTERLLLAQGSERGENGAGFDRLMRRDRGKGPRHFGQVLDPAQAAARFRDAAADPVLQLVDAQPCQLGANDPAQLDFGNGNVGNIAGRDSQPFAQRKSGGEILKVLRARHHHRIGQAVEFQRNGRFRHPGARDRAPGAVRLYFGYIRCSAHSLLPSGSRR